MHPERRRLLLHIGIGKTGSSALQVALARSRSQLSMHGVSYPEHESDAAALAGKVMSGNGGAILELFAPRTKEQADADAAYERLNRVLDNEDAQTTLYSSEFFYNCSRESVGNLHRTMSERGIDLQVVVYVRNMAGHAVSSYSQAVKRRLFTGTFREYIDREAGGAYRPVVRNKIQMLLKVIGRENLYVLHYDSVRSRLVPHFFNDVLGVPIDDMALADPGERINRSFTSEEVELMRYANQFLTGRRHAHILSDTLLERPPLGSGPIRVTPADIDLLCDFYDSDMAWLNDTFFRGQSVASVMADDVTVEDSDRAAASTLNERDRYLVDCMVALTRIAAKRSQS